MEKTFEEALSRLEEIVDTVENSETTLDTAMALYKEGLALSKACGDMLNRYEAEIMLLQKGTPAEDAYSLEPFPAP